MKLDVFPSNRTLNVMLKMCHLSYCCTHLLDVSKIQTLNEIIHDFQGCNEQWCKQSVDNWAGMIKLVTLESKGTTLLYGNTERLLYVLLKVILCVMLLSSCHLTINNKNYLPKDQSTLFHWVQLTFDGVKESRKLNVILSYFFL